MVCLPDAVGAHDPSAWGGVYRSRDGGATWILANEGRFVTAALDLAISPVDPTHLLLATDSGLLRSRNGGRDWAVEVPQVLAGAVFAVAFDDRGERALASTGRELFADEGDGTWQAVAAPPGSAPARGIVAGVDGRVYLAGWSGLSRSDDWGASWADLGDGLPVGPVTGLVVGRATADDLLAVAGGGLWASGDGGRSWQPRDNGLPAGGVEAVALDPDRPDLLWAAGADQVFRGDERGASWQPVGVPLDEPDTAIRAVAVAADHSAILLSTHRGVYRGVDGGRDWELLVDNVPSHLEARPLVRDPRDPTALYAGFSITPYDALWESAADGRSLLRRLDAVNLAGGVAFLLLVLLAAGWAVRYLARFYGPAVDDAFRRPAHAGPAKEGERTAL